MSFSREVLIPASELSLGELKSQAQRALRKKKDNLDGSYRETRARENLATIEDILRIPEVGAYLSRSRKRVPLLRVNEENSSGIQHQYWLYTEGTSVFLRLDYLKRGQGGWTMDCLDRISSYDFPQSNDVVVKAMSELNAKDIVEKYKRALSRRPF